MVRSGSCRSWLATYANCCELLVRPLQVLARDRSATSRSRAAVEMSRAMKMTSVAGSWSGRSATKLSRTLKTVPSFRRHVVSTSPRPVLDELGGDSRPTRRVRLVVVVEDARSSAPIRSLPCVPRHLQSRSFTSLEPPSRPASPGRCRRGPRGRCSARAARAAGRPARPAPRVPAFIPLARQSWDNHEGRRVQRVPEAGRQHSAHAPVRARGVEVAGVETELVQVGACPSGVAWPVGSASSERTAAASTAGMR